MVKAGDKFLVYNGCVNVAVVTAVSVTDTGFKAVAPYLFKEKITFIQEKNRNPESWKVRGYCNVPKGFGWAKARKLEPDEDPDVLIAKIDEDEKARAVEKIERDKKQELLRIQQKKEKEEAIDRFWNQDGGKERWDNAPVINTRLGDIKIWTVETDKQIKVHSIYYHYVPDSQDNNFIQEGRPQRMEWRASVSTLVKNKTVSSLDFSVFNCFASSSWFNPSAPTLAELVWRISQ